MIGNELVPKIQLHAAICSSQPKLLTSFSIIAAAERTSGEYSIATANCTPAEQDSLAGKKKVGM